MSTRTRSIGYGFLLLAAVCALIALAEGAARTCPANEVYVDCGNSCQTRCATLNQPCLIRHIRCPDGCYCIEGFARDDTGKCIPIENCPKVY